MRVFLLAAYQGSYTCNGGKISNYGSFYVLIRGVKDDLGREVGVECWSEKLGEFSGGRHHVCIEIDGVAVLEESNREVARIAFNDFSWVSFNSIRTVMRGGHLFSTDMINEDLVESLERAVRGERPACLDNSVFVQVPVEYVGRSLRCLRFSSIQEENRSIRIFTLDGKPVKRRVHYPLAYAKWVPNSPWARYSETEPIPNAEFTFT